MKGVLIVLVGALLYLGTTVFLITRSINAMPEMGGTPLVEKTELPPQIWGFKTEVVDQLVAELKTSKETLAGEQKKVATQKVQLEAERAELGKIREELTNMRTEIDQRVVEIQEGEMKNLKTLAQTYAAMPPLSAVAIFREMDENMVVKILSFMKVDRVGPILGEMGKLQEKNSEESMAKRAARISDKLRLLKPIKKENPA